MTEASKRGRELFFGKASCSACHVGPDLSDELFHNIGIGQQGPEPFLGRFAVTGDEADHKRHHHAAGDGCFQRIQFGLHFRPCNKIFMGF